MILVIGYGNPLCGDDGVGQVIVEYLAQHLPADVAREVTLLARHQLAPELTEPVSRADLVIFIDAEVGDAPGEIVCRTVDQPPDSCPFTHSLNPSSILMGARALFGATPDAVIISIIGTSFGFGEGLSPPVARALPDLFDLLLEMMNVGVRV